MGVSFCQRMTDGKVTFVGCFKNNIVCMRHTDTYEHCLLQQCFYHAPQLSQLLSFIHNCVRHLIVINTCGSLVDLITRQWFYVYVYPL